MDASEGITEQDITIAGYAHDRGCGCVFVLNKWDLAETAGASETRMVADLREQAKFLSFAPAHHRVGPHRPAGDPHLRPW